MNNKKILTIFTPTYNRKEKLNVLYRSLIDQTDKRFVWIIVDDGSDDGTDAEVNKWINDNIITIQYTKQVNSGKSVAHNRGVDLCVTQLFTCVDSDDYLTSNAVERIIESWGKHSNTDIGILAFRGVTKVLSQISTDDDIHITLHDAYKKLGLRGDTMLIYDINHIRKHKFPVFEGEKFVPEAYIYDLLDQEGKLLLLPEVLYLGDYLDDGYTKNMANVIKNNPKGYEAFILQRLEFDKGWKEILGDTVRLFAIEFVLKKYNMFKKGRSVILTLICYPLGLYLYFRRYRI